MASDREAVNRNYGRPELGTAILAALQAAGKDMEALTRDDLAPFEDLHQRGRAATRDLANLAALPRGARVLDIGCGIGGPARLFAAEHGWRVEGVDLTEEFVRAAEALTQAARVEPAPTFRVADAARLPFPDGTFDGAFLIHVSMNVRDKEAVFREVARVLRRGGVFVLFEVCRTPGGGEPIYPTVWASGPEWSFLATAEEMRAAVKAAGFREDDWTDETPRSVEWYRGADRRASQPPHVGYDIVLGPDVATRRDNQRRNVEEGRVAVVRGRFVREGPGDAT